MTATAAEALELAIWLHRAPSRRAALLGRPLPDGVGQLLRVAGGARDQVAAAARITGEDEATILEAVRFYLQQVLFHDETDAYRMLGLRPDATQAQAREHHRLLQQWLHPDRHGDDQWETVYAGRINRAWTQLRTSQARATYDAARIGAVASGNARPEVGSPLPARPVPVGEPQPANNRSRTVTLTVLAGCAALLVLVVLRNEQPPDWGDDRGESTISAPNETAVAGKGEFPDGSALLATLALAGEPTAHVETAASAAPSRALASADVPRQPPAQAALPSPRAPRRAAASVTVPRVLPSEPLAAPQVQSPRHDEAEEGMVLAAASPIVVAPAMASAGQSSALLPDAAARIAEARQRARHVAAFLDDFTVVTPPVWNDIPTMRDAQAIRVELHKRLGFPRRAGLRFEDPQWRLGPEGAQLDTGYVAGAEKGVLAISFAWREDRLLVREISLVPGA